MRSVAQETTATVKIGGRTRQIILATALSGGGVGMVGALTMGLLYGQAALARRAIPLAEAPPPRSDGRYEAAADLGPDLQLALLGDSSAAGFGVDRPRDTPGALLATGIAEQLNRNVYLRSHAVVGAMSSNLEPQVDRALRFHPDVAVILVGANDVTHRESVQISAGYLANAVKRLRAAGAEVVVCTCPDLGTIRPIRPPLRWMARRWSREMAAAQTVAAVAAGARTVSLGDLIGPEFDSAPDRMFGSDRFHPSVTGYAAAVSVILPTVLASLRTGATEESLAAPSGERVRSLVRAAAEAATQPGTEVSAAPVAGGAGRWAAQLRHRMRQLVERPQDPTVTSAVATADGSE